MEGDLKISTHDRVLVLAPHPDDETLAAGDLIQSAVAAGAALRIVFATDGDNNPWPQRWLERRWRIGTRERARWGARRRREALAALLQLGVAEPAAIARFLGWPDQGLTALLLRDDAAIETLAEEIAQFAPTHLVVPVLADRHPDHSALRVLADLALLRAGHACLRLGYVVHGEGAHEANRLLTVAAYDVQAKQRAMLAHASQMALSGKRLLGLAARPNRFVSAEPSPLPPGAWRRLRLARPASWHRHDLLLVIALREEIVRLSLPSPRRSPATRATDARGRAYALEYDEHDLQVVLPDFGVVPNAVYAKFHRRQPRLLIFDREFWRHDAELLGAPEPALTDSAQSGYI